MSKKTLDELVETGDEPTGEPEVTGETETKAKKEVDPVKKKASKLRRSVRMLIEQGVDDSSILSVFKHVKNISDVVAKVHESPGRAVFSKKSKSGKFASIKELMYHVFEDEMDVKEAVKFIAKEYPDVAAKENGAVKLYKKFRKVWNWAHGTTE